MAVSWLDADPRELDDDERLDLEPCDRCEGSGHHYEWYVDNDGAEGAVVNPDRPCRYCGGTGGMPVKLQEIEQEELWPDLDDDNDLVMR